GGVKTLLISELLQGDVNWNRLAEISNKISSMDVLYVLFTSGSTGIPKGVTIGQRSVMDYTEWVTDTFGVNEHTVLGNQAPFYFDNSVLHIYQMISVGATLHIIPRKLFKFPLRLLEYVRDNSVNMIFWVPSVLCTIANFEVLDACNVSCLKKVLFAGEVMPNKQLNVWRKTLSNTLFANLYGPTEITVDCAYYIVDREFVDSDPLPIGLPCRNSDIIVLNENDKQVTGNEQGELCVRGSSLAYGYYNNPEKTKEVFTQNPLNDNYPEIIYRTGDMVHYNERGELMYDGRKDFQVKHMGHRIELGEIETAVSSVKGVESNCCVFDDEKDMLIVCYIGAAEERELRLSLSSLLPEYMMPRRYCKLDNMPLNRNGKIDRVKMKAMFCPA
ncbi:MAG: AMP-binding protein, partial [Selenomonadaceae bacterium]|nr:AMP-binding protein [Selenomonadaceae bacterium]